MPRWPTFGPAIAAIQPQKRLKRSQLESLPQPRQQLQRRQRLQACRQSRMEMMMEFHAEVSSINSQ